MNLDKLKFSVKEYLTFTQGEKVGILVLLTLLILVTATSMLLPHLLPEKPNIDVTKFEQEIALFEKSSDSTKRIVNSSKDNHPKSTKQEHKSRPVILVELNTADSAALDQLPGIGPVFASRIIKYRTMLGGYYSVNQLVEVYGLKPETAEKLKRFLTIDTTQIQKIDLNNASFKQINAHPYISYEQTKAICKLRTHNKILSVNQLEKLHLFTSSELTKIKPYLTITQ